jgi:multidrug resistance protein, MATE family
MTAQMSKSTHARETLALGLPLAGAQLAQMALHVTDTLSWSAGMAWCRWPPWCWGHRPFSSSTCWGRALRKAVMPMVASAVARGDEAQVRRDTRMGLWLSIGFGLLLLPAFWESGAILLALGQNPEVAAVAQDYLRIVGFGMVPALCVTVLQSYLSASWPHAGGADG